MIEILLSLKYSCLMSHDTWASHYNNLLWYICSFPLKTFNRNNSQLYDDNTLASLLLLKFSNCLWNKRKFASNIKKTITLKEKVNIWKSTKEKPCWIYTWKSWWDNKIPIFLEDDGLLCQIQQKADSYWRVFSNKIVKKLHTINSR